MPEAEETTVSVEEPDICTLLGCEISDVAQLAAQILRRTGAYSVLCPACGHGQCSAYLAHSGFQVTAYDITEHSISRVARNAALAGVRVDCFVDDVVVPRRRLRHFDALFSHSVLHQMRAQQRHALLRSFHRALKQGGVLLVSVLACEDERYGLGREVEPDTFEFAMGEHLHFYSAGELRDELSEFFEVARVEPMQEVQTHCGLGRQTYRLLVATALKVDR